MSYNWAPLPEGLSLSERQIVIELRALKRRHRLTFKQLGRLTHYSHSSWERWLNGKRTVTPEAVDALATALGIDGSGLLDLLSGAAAPSAEPEPEQPAPAAVPTNAAAPTNAPARPPSPAQLPAVAGRLAGRDRELRQIVDLLVGGDAPGVVPTVTVTGSGGLGKTALAVQAGHLAARHFPDGQLYVDLRGADAAPDDPAAVLRGWLLELGESAADVPADPAARAARFRSVVAGRRMLLVLDNAADAAQVRPLIPGTSGCAVLVTARTRLTDLLGARHLTLTHLGDDAARQLLSAAIGSERAQAEPEAMDRLLACCAGLPLALHIAGARLAGRTAWTAALLADRLHDERRRLDELSVGDIAVRTAFQASYRNLIGPRTAAAHHDTPARPDKVSAAEAFRLLGLLPFGHFGADAAAALLGTTPRHAEDLLETLADAHLVEPSTPGCYRLHDLLRSYARELAETEESAEQCRAAITRLVHWYIHSSSAATARIASRDVNWGLDRLAGPHTAALSFAEREDAIRWFLAEQHNIIALIALAEEQLPGAEAWVLAEQAHEGYLQRGAVFELRTSCELGLRCARRIGDPVGRVRLLSHLAHTLARLDLMEESLQASRGAVEASEESDDPRLIAISVSNYATALDQAGRVDESVLWFERAVRETTAHGRVEQLAATELNFGITLRDCGRLDESDEHLGEALRLIRTVDWPYAEGYALEALGRLRTAQGRTAEALPILEESAAVRLRVGDRAGHAASLEHLADALLAADRPAEARAAWEQAVALRDELGDTVMFPVRVKLRDHFAGSPA